MPPKSSPQSQRHMTGSKSNYSQGIQAERQVMTMLKEDGYKNISQSAGSRGTYDLVAVKGNEHHGFQVKSTHTPGNEPNISRNELNKIHSVAKMVPQVTPHVTYVDQNRNTVTDHNLKTNGFRFY